MTAQGFNGWRRPEEIGAAKLGKAIGRLGLLQIDSVNVLVRAHYLPLYSRLGPYDRALLDAAISAKTKRLFEYWGHEASLLPIDCHPLLRWRMARALRGQGVWGGLEPFAHERRSEADALLARIEREGPLAASDVAGERTRKGMWAWSDAKHALEWLFWAGLVASTHRRGSFERVYDLPDRVLPRAILEAPTPRGVDARRELIARAARSLGVATAGDLRDFYRLSPADAERPIAQLVEEGTLIPVSVRGWSQQTYLHNEARAGRRLEGSALLSPFDPLVWRPSAHRKVVRLPLSSRDLHAGAQARARLLRAALPHGRRPRRPRGPEGRPKGRRTDRPADACRGGRAEGGGGEVDGGITGDGGVAGVGEGCWGGGGWPLTCRA